MGAEILHIAAADAWRDAQARGDYRGDALETEGFIHCSRPEQIARVARDRFPEPRGFVVLVIDRARITSPVVDENLEGGDELFPHIYGALNLDAVRNVIDLATHLTG